LMLAVAGWMRYVGGIDERDEPIDVKDPLARELQGRLEAVSSPDQKVAALLAMREIFGSDLADRLAAPVAQAYTALSERGARKSVEDLL
ncbi:MAG: mannitol dehydrogenase family protein, partial [Hoeflea sp.]